MEIRKIPPGVLFILIIRNREWRKNYKYISISFFRRGKSRVDLWSVRFEDAVFWEKSQFLCPSYITENDL